MFSASKAVMPHLVVLGVPDLPMECQGSASTVLPKGGELRGSQGWPRHQDHPTALHKASGRARGLLCSTKVSSSAPNYHHSGNFSVTIQRTAMASCSA